MTFASTWTLKGIVSMTFASTWTLKTLLVWHLHQLFACAPRLWNSWENPSFSDEGKRNVIRSSSSIATWVVVYGVGMQREMCFLSFFVSCCEPVVALLLRVCTILMSSKQSKKAWYLDPDQDRTEVVCLSCSKAPVGLLWQVLSKKLVATSLLLFMVPHVLPQPPFPQLSHMQEKLQQWLWGKRGGMF